MEQNINPSISKKLDKLLEEKDKTEKQLEQAIRKKSYLERRLKREENRSKHIDETERKNRTHRLCIKGGVIESLLPGTVDFSEKEFYELIEEVFKNDEAKRVLMMKTEEHQKRKECRDG